MKNSLKKLTILLLTIFLMSGTLPAQKQNILGVWHLVSGKTNGKLSPSALNNRTWEFKKDNTFEGRKLLPDNTSRKYNEGIYMLPTDTTMVCLHKYSNGKMSPLAFKYAYTIRNDSLHLHGYYLIGVRDKPGLLQMMHIDEWWVKTKKCTSKK